MRPRQTEPINSLFDWTSEDSNEKGDQFEKFLIWWLVNDPEMQVTHGFTKVALLEDWSENPFQGDVGIDLVAWDRNSELFAIQAKHHDRATNLGKDPIAILAGVAKLTNQGGPFTGRMVVSTTDDFTSNAKAIAADQDVQLLSNAHLERSAAVIAFPRSEDELDLWLDSAEGTTRQKLSRRAHQQAAVTAVLKHFEENWRGQMLMACGTGKTLTSLWAKEELFATGRFSGEHGLAVVLLPSISLLEQTLREWAVNRSTDWRALAVCSDSTVSSSRKGDEEDMKVVDSGLPVTTDKDTIKTFLAQDGSERIIFSTYQSSHLVAEAALEIETEFDLVLCDEAHRLSGSAEKQFSLVLDVEKFPACRRLFMTATPRVLTPSAKKNAADRGAAVMSMDDHTQFGEVAFSYNFGQAIADGQLSDYQVVVAVTSDKEALELCREGTFVEVNGKQMTATDLAAAIAVMKAADKHDARRCISFHRTITRSRDFRDLLGYLGNEKLSNLPASVNADFVSGGTSAKDRRRKLDSLRDGPASFNLLANARCLTEGVDVPSLDAVAFVDPRQSEVDIVQAVGRAIRKSDDKRLGTIIVPVVLSSKGNEAELDEAGHKKLRQVLWALRSHDSELAAQIDNVVFGLPVSGAGPSRSSLAEKIIVEDLDGALGDFAGKFTTELFDIGCPDNVWAKHWNSSKSFYETHNKWPTTGTDDLEEKRLGIWVNNQRVVGKKLAAGQKSAMTRERYEILDTYPGWEWDPLAIAWNNSWEAVKAFVETRNRWPFQTADDLEEKQLGIWMQAQRTQGKKLVAGQKSAMTRERYEILDAYPGWEWDPFVAAWNNNWEASRTFYETHNRWPTTRTDDLEEKRLGSWVVIQRTQGKKLVAGQKSVMTQERYEILDAYAGWEWDPRITTWDPRWEAAKTFYETYKKWPARTNADSPELKQLANWVRLQRTEGRKLAAGQKSAMTRERYEILNAYPGWEWDPFVAAWNNNWEAARTFYETHDRWPVTRTDDLEEKQLGNWVGDQRTQGIKRAAGQKSAMTRERYEILDTYPGWEWDPLAIAWNNNWEAARTFYETHDRWPVTSTDDLEEKQLGDWVGNQRTQGKKLVAGQKSVMTRERYEILDAYPGWEWDLLATAWDLHWEAARTFYETHNRWPLQTAADLEEKQLGIWMQAQRTQGKKLAAGQKSAMTRERYEILDAYPGWEWVPLAIAWNNNWEAARTFYETHDRWPVTRTDDLEEKQLGNWVGNQRTQGKKLVAGQKSSMTQERYEILLAYPGWEWDPFVVAWNNNWEAARTFYETHDRWPTTRTDDLEEKQIGGWVQKQRDYGRKMAAGEQSVMAQARYDLLDAHPGWKWIAR